MRLFRLSGLLLALILGLPSAPVGAPPLESATEPNPHFKDALWVAESEQVLKLALADGTVLLEIPYIVKFDALAIDEASGTLWAFGEGRLHAYSFAGEKRYTVVPPYDRHDIDADDHEEENNDEVDGGEGRSEFLTLNPNDGSLWLAGHKNLYHYDRDAQMLERIRLPKRAKALALDPTRDEVWVGTEAGLQRYDAFGRPVDVLRPALSHIRALAYERDGDALWVLDKKQGLLRRYALANGVLEREVALPIKAKDVDVLVPDGRGGLWIGEDHTLIKLDRDGEVQFHLKPFAGPGNDKLVALIADPVDGSAWAASKDRITKLSAEGELQQSFTPSSGNKKPKIRALALYLDSAAPILSFTAPAKDALLNTNQPQFAFLYSDAGVGVDANTLALTLDEEPLAVSCDHSEAKATCTPSEGLSEGAHTLAGTIADFHGHVSVPSRVSFMVDTVAPAAASVPKSP